MSLKTIKELLENTGVPTTYRAWEEGAAPPLPFLCYLETGTNNFAADGVVYLNVLKINVELYTKLRNQSLEDKVEEALSSFFWEKSITYLEAQKCYEILYEIEV